MKKFLVVLLSAMMVFAFATTAFAAGQYTDVADLSKEGQDAISKLSALEIITGYPDGTFKPSATITRAEFAKMACVAAGMNDSASMLGGAASQFSDVKPNEWYTGYVNLAVSQGYVKGYPDGTFKPNNTITNAEVVTVILRIMGYNDNLPGPWPVDYVAKAGNLEITSGLSFATSSNAVRGDVARMIDNALEENVVVWNNDIDDFDDKYREPTTLLEESFKGEVVVDQRVKDWSVDSFAKGNLSITVEANERNVKDAGTFVVTDATVVSGGYNIYDINNMDVELIVKNDKDLKKDVVKYVDVKSSKVKATSAANVSNGRIKIGDKQYTVVEDAKIPSETKNTFYTGYINEDNELYLITADSTNAGDSYIVDEYVSSNGRIQGYNNDLTVRNNDVMIFDANDKAIELSDLKEFDLIKVYEDKGDADYVIFVQEWQEGTLNSVQGSSKMTIAGTGYAMNTPSYFEDGDEVSADDDYIGSNVKFALDAQNQVIGVIYTESGLGNTLYGVVMDADTTSGSLGNTKTYWSWVTLFNEDGKKVTYDVESKEIEEGDVTMNAGSLVKVRLTKDGEIHDIKVATLEDTTGKATVDTKNDRIYLKDKNAAGTTVYNIESKLIAFDITFDDDDVDTVSLVTPETIASGDVKSSSIQYILTSDNKDIAAMGLTDFVSKGNAKFGFIKSTGHSTSDFNNGIKFYGDNTVYELKNNFTPDEDSFWRYELSGDKVTLIKNQDNGVDATATTDEIDLDDFGPVEIENVSKGVRYTANGDFTIESDTVILEITRDAKTDAIKDIKTTSSVGKGEMVYVMTRAQNNETGLDANEEMEALFVVIEDTDNSSSVTPTVNASEMVYVNADTADKATFIFDGETYTNKTGEEMKAGWYNNLTVNKTGEITKASKMTVPTKATGVLTEMDKNDIVVSIPVGNTMKDTTYALANNYIIVNAADNTPLDTVEIGADVAVVTSNSNAIMIFVY